MFRRLRRLQSAILGGQQLLEKMADAQDSLMMMAGKTAAFSIRQASSLASIQDAEFKVFSQFGDDGIIQYLTHMLGIRRGRFIEFGVENYQEANTRFLLRNNDWEGLVIDGSEDNVAQINNSNFMWRHHLTARAAFITCENINSLFAEEGFNSNIDLLSIDIDGNDYYVWEQIQDISPAIVIAEYNSVFGLEPVSIPYDATFQRTKAHHSNLYWGCSISALEHIGKAKGYALVGSNSAGNNAYFVRRDCMTNLKEITALEAHVDSHFKESRDKQGRLTYLTGVERLEIIKSMPLVNVITGENLIVADLPC